MTPGGKAVQIGVNMRHASNASTHSKSSVNSTNIVLATHIAIQLPKAGGKASWVRVGSKGSIGGITIGGITIGGITIGGITIGACCSPKAAAVMVNAAERCKQEHGIC